MNIDFKSIIQAAASSGVNTGCWLLTAGLVAGSFSLGVQVLQYISYFLTGDLHIDPQLPVWVGKDIGFALVAAHFALKAYQSKANHT